MKNKKINVEINMITEIPINKVDRPKIKELSDAINGAHLAISVLSAKIGRLSTELDEYIKSHYPSTTENRGCWRINETNTMLVRDSTWKVRDKE